MASMATLLGGVIFWRLALARAGVNGAAGELMEKIAAAYRPLVLASIVGLTLSGFINYLTTPGHTRYYHVLFGIKMLLALHVFAAAFLMVQPHHPRRVRLATSIMISGLIILFISAWLRRIF